ncbi:HNH endonuclease [Psychrobacillus sp. AK 1817]|uniref:HNH endonuclease n=1 Tax=Psychrobacillus sp. AK 1817 TaxID=2303505 RepID=UPI001244FDD3|nr:HNH endonuclease [Psychrobacillus sp. AK 1817]QEY22434.1 HNH endonuclease [Psychrobacillus sp. AK 1817]
MIEEYCRLFKTCSICGRLKYHTKFVSNGRDKSRRKSYCHECKSYKKMLSSNSFDIKVLKKTRINVRLKISSKNRVFYTVSYNNAVAMVEEKVAFIVKDNLIYLMYSNTTFKEMILERDGFLCRYCNALGNTLDHVIPKSKGGISTFSNCVCCCDKCNNEKGDLLLEEFLRNRIIKML